MRVPWVVRDERGEIVCRVAAETQEEAIAAFCHPALNPDAFFGPDGGWTVEHENEGGAE